MTLIGPLEPEFEGGEINLRVITTSAVRLVTAERDTETDVATPANMAGKFKFAIVSKPAPLESKVEMTRSSFAATTEDGRMSPCTVQTTFELAVGKPVELTAMLKKGLV